MLVLSRKAQESIKIGKGITITVLEIRHGCVRIGIKTDPFVPVHREEVWVAMQEQKEDS